MRIEKAIQEAKEEGYALGRTDKHQHCLVTLDKYIKYHPNRVDYYDREEYEFDWEFNPKRGRITHPTVTIELFKVDS